MKSELWTLLGTQLASPLARVLFAVVLVPLHPEGAELILVVGLAELLSTFLTCGRSYLVAGGFNHHLVSKWFDVLILAALTGGAYRVLATEEQQVFVWGVVVMTVAINIMTMANAYLLRERRLHLVLPVNFAVYILAAFGPLFGPTVAGVAVCVWVLFEGRMPSSPVMPTSRVLPVVATLLAFASQRVDVQAAAFTADSVLLRDVYQLNTLFMPLALFVRLVGNTALLRGRPMLDPTPGVRIIIGLVGVGYGALIWAAGKFLSNDLIVSNILVLLATAVLSTMTVPYREAIAIRSRHSDFKPLFWFSLVGVVPGAIYLLFANLVDTVSGATFLMSLYLAPRVLMFIYGWALGRSVQR